MPDGTSISLAGDISKPADTLIKKVSKAVGGIFAPYQVERMAKADAAAMIIKAETEIEIADIQRRAMHRFIDEETQRQKNIEDITAKAVPQLNENSNPDKMEDDWVTNFFDKSRIVSDGEMQNLWSRVLAGEANVPGTYSKRTVNFLSDLDKTDAQAFSKLCGYVWTIGELTPLVFDIENEIYKKHGVDFDTITHLDSIGLIQFEALTGFARGGCAKRFSWGYYGRFLTIEMPKDLDNTVETGKALFTKIGRELAPISGGKPVNGFFEYVCDKLEKQITKPKIAFAGPPHAAFA
jgi:hypothetical protein